MKKRQFFAALFCFPLFAFPCFAAACEKYTYYRGLFTDLPADQMGYAPLDGAPGEKEAAFRLERDTACRAKEIVFLHGGERENAFHWLSKIRFKYPNGSSRDVEQRDWFSKTSPAQISTVHLFKRNAQGQAVRSVLLKDYVIKKFDFDYQVGGGLKSVSESTLEMDHFVKRKQTDRFVFDRDGRLVSFSVREAYAPDRIQVSNLTYGDSGLLKQWAERNSNEDTDSRLTRYEYDMHGFVQRKLVRARRMAEQRCYGDFFKYDRLLLQEVARSSGCQFNPSAAPVVNTYEYAADGTIRKFVDDISDSHEKVIFTSLFNENGKLVSDVEKAASAQAKRQSETTYRYDAAGNFIESKYRTRRSDSNEREERVSSSQYSASGFSGLEEHSKTFAENGQLSKHELKKITRNADGSYALKYQVLSDPSGAGDAVSLLLN